MVSVCHRQANLTIPELRCPEPRVLEVRPNPSILLPPFISNRCSLLQDLHVFFVRDSPLHQQIIPRDRAERNKIQGKAVS